MVSRNLKKPVLRLLSQAMLPMVAFGVSSLAQAADANPGPEPEMSVTYNIGAVSDYRVRGIAQTSGKPAIQGGIDVAFKNGFYLGTAASNVKWVKEFNGATKGSYEVDLYGGYKAQVTDTSFSYDVGVIRYQYPGNNSGAVGTPGEGLYSNANTTEIYGALTYKMFTFKYNRSIGDFLGNLNSSGSQYFDLSANIDLTNGFTLTPHVGRQLIPNQTLPGNYTDYALTLAKDFGNGFSATAAVMGTNASRDFYTDFNDRFLGNSTVVVGVKYSF